MNKPYCIHPVACIGLTKGHFDEVLADENSSYNVFLVSPIGNIFVLGDTENFEIVDLDNGNLQYIIEDAGDTERRILFNHDGNSNYGILIGNNGPIYNSTGICFEGDDLNWKNTIDVETGVIGQDAPEYDDNEDEDEEE